MTKSLNKLIFILLIALHFGCNKNSKIDNFMFEIKDFDGSSGQILNYRINKDSLKIIYNCDFQDCEEKIIYSIKLKERKILKFYEYLKKNTTDTLKAKYTEQGYDGLNLLIRISGDSLNSKRIRLERFWHPEIEKLIIEMDKLIKDKKFKFLKKAVLQTTTV